MEIETKVSIKNNKNEIVSGDVCLYNDDGEVVKKITIIESEVLQELKSTIDTWDNNYLSLSNLSEILRNLEGSTVINATSIRGINSDDIIVKGDLEYQMGLLSPPKIHDSNTAALYGAGTTDRYGHVKIRNDCNAANFQNSEALSSYQGAVLKNQIDALENSNNSLQENYNRNSLRVNILRTNDPNGVSETKQILSIGSGDAIYARISCDDPSFSLKDKTVIMVINGVPYTRTTDSTGTTSTKDVNLPKGKYVVQVFARGNSNVRSASDMKILDVA